MGFKARCMGYFVSNLPFQFDLQHLVLSVSRIQFLVDDP